MTPTEATPSEPTPPLPGQDFKRHPNRKRRWGRWTMLAVLLGVALLAALPALLSTSWVNDAVRTWLRDNVNRPVDFASLDISWLEGVTITDLRVHEEGRDGEPMLRAPLVEIDTALLPLLYREVEITRFVIHEPTIRLAQNENGTNADTAIKRKKVKRKRRRRNGDDEPEVEEPEEALVLPRINVPVEIRNATLVFVNEDGHEGRQDNVQFTGHLSTRDGPTTFDLSMSDGPDSGVFAKGTAILFDSEGVLLDAREREVDATVTIQNVDAERNRDLVALVLGDSPATGVVNGKLVARTRGNDVDGVIELVVSDVAVGDAVGKREPGAEDLRIQGSFLYADDMVRVDGLFIRGEGLEAYLQVEGDKTALDGEGELHADLDQMQRALAAMGLDIEGLSGRIDGNVNFTSDPSQGIGTLFATNVFVPSPIEGRPPVSLDGSRLDFTVKPSEDGLLVEKARLTMPEFSADASGLIGRGGGLDVTTRAAGDLDRVLGRLRDLGLAPQDLSLAGTIDAEVRTTRSANGGQPGMVIERLDLTGDDVSIQVRGTRSPSGELDFRATGSGDIARLLGATAAGSSVDLGAVRGRFDFAVGATGTQDELDVLVERLHLDGDVNLDATARVAPDGRLSGDLTADGRVESIVSLLRRMGFLEGDVPLRGRLTAQARIAGTRDAPEVPSARLDITDGAVRASATGSLAADGALEATIDATAGLDELLDLARAMGKIETAPTPGGELTLKAVIGGTRDDPIVPTAQLRMTGPLELDVRGSLDQAGHAQARGTAHGRLQPLLDVVAATRGEPARNVPGALDAEFSAEGPRDALTVRVPRLALTSNGATATLSGVRRPDGAAEGSLTLQGAVGDLLAVANGLGYVQDYSGTGNVDGRVGLVTVEDTGRLRADVVATLSNLNLVRAAKTGEAPGRLSLSQARLVVEPFTFDRETRAHDPIAARLELADTRVDVAIASGLADGAPLDATITAAGPLQPVLDVAALVTGGDATRLGGDFSFEARASGTRDAPRIEVPRLKITSGDLSADVTATVPDERTADVKATIAGDIARALAIAQSFGKAEGQQATGRFSLDATAQMRQGIATAGFDATATDVVMTDPDDPSAAPTREPRLHISAPSIRYDKDAGRVDPFRVLAEATGARIEGTVSYAEGPVPAGATDPSQDVTWDGTVLLTKEFVANHPDLFEDAKLERIEGPLRFSGDVSRGRDGAATWNGAFDVRATTVTAPYVRIDWLTLKGTIASGVVEVAQLEGLVNDGSVSGAGRFGLVGKRPEHSLTIDARDVTIDGELAPLLARAAPILSVGESGTVRGKTGITAHFTADGSGSRRIKNTLNGNGMLRLRNVEVQSSGWVGGLLQVVGAGSLLSIADAEVPFVVENGKVTTSDLPIEAAGFGMKLGGEVTLDGAMDYRLGVKSSNKTGQLGKFGSLADDDGYVPLRLKGDISDPSLKLPSLSDALGGGVDDLWDKLRGKDKDKDDDEADDAETDEERRKRRRKERRKKRQEEGGGGDDPPPPPPPR